MELFVIQLYMNLTSSDMYKYWYVPRTLKQDLKKNIIDIRWRIYIYVYIAKEKVERNSILVQVAAVFRYILHTHFKIVNKKVKKWNKIKKETLNYEIQNLTEGPFSEAGV